jgi:hypothetical protein
VRDGDDNEGVGDGQDEGFIPPGQEKKGEDGKGKDED